MKYMDGVKILLEARNKGLIDDFSVRGDDTWIGATVEAESNAEPLLELFGKQIILLKPVYSQDDAGFVCPICGCDVYSYYNCCQQCGQALQWKKKKRGHK